MAGEDSASKKGKGKASRRASDRSPTASASLASTSPTLVLPEYIPPEGSLKSRAPGRQNVACKCVLVFVHAVQKRKTDRGWTALAEAVVAAR